MDRVPSASGQETDRQNLFASSTRLAAALRELLPGISAQLGHRDGVTAGSVRLSSHSVQQELEKAGPALKAVVDALRSRTAGQRMNLFDKFTASAGYNADESSTGGGYSGEGGGAVDEGGGAVDESMDEGGGAGNEGGGAGDDGGGDGSAGKAAKPVTAAAARREFDSTDTPFQKHASLFALRSYISVGFQKSLLLEGDSCCDDCKEPSPGVVDYCRSPSGDRLCYSCDAARHGY